ncbi:MAG: hypothetical protein ACHQ53_04225 [Polyangiales bacterium]
MFMELLCLIPALLMFTIVGLIHRFRANRLRQRGRLLLGTREVDPPPGPEAASPAPKYELAFANARLMHGESAKR